mmetsp:Transcript_64043/g.152750  ORF Transcript_64043/g.152750 Transcript_64043/m.152750 type:complete len:247 (-) Transcript_64043:15-755(-)
MAADTSPFPKRSLATLLALAILRASLRFRFASSWSGSRRSKADQVLTAPSRSPLPKLAFPRRKRSSMSASPRRSRNDSHMVAASWKEPTPRSARTMSIERCGACGAEESGARRYARALAQDPSSRSEEARPTSSPFLRANERPSSNSFAPGCDLSAASQSATESSNRPSSTAANAPRIAALLLFSLCLRDSLQSARASSRCPSFRSTWARFPSTALHSSSTSSFALPPAAGPVAPASCANTVIARV